MLRLSSLLIFVLLMIAFDNTRGRQHRGWKRKISEIYKAVVLKNNDEGNTTCCQSKEFNDKTFTLAGVYPDAPPSGCSDQCIYSQDGLDQHNFCFAFNKVNSNCHSAPKQVIQKLPDVSQLVGDATSRNFIPDFEYKVERNAPIIATIPTWGPTFAIEFGVIFNTLPNTNEELDVLAFISGSEIVQEQAILKGKNIPRVTLQNGNTGVHLRVYNEIIPAIPDSYPDSSIVLSTKIKANHLYKLNINQKYVPTEEQKNEQVRFTVDLSDGSNLLSSKSAISNIPTAYSDVGIFAMNSIKAADARIRDLKYDNNIDGDYELLPTSLGTAATFDPSYEVSFKLSIDEEKSDIIHEEDPLDLLTIVEPNDDGAYLPAVSLFTSKGGQKNGRKIPILCFSYKKFTPGCEDGLLTEENDWNLGQVNNVVFNQILKDGKYTFSAAINGKKVGKDGSIKITEEEANNFKSATNVKYELLANEKPEVRGEGRFFRKVYGKAKQVHATSGKVFEAVDSLFGLF